VALLFYQVRSKGFHEASTRLDDVGEHNWWGAVAVATGQSPRPNRLQEQATQISREAGNRVSNTVSVPLRQAVRAPQPTGQELSKYEKMLCDMANEERRKRGLPP
jgi:hypothetical protein